MHPSARLGRTTDRMVLPQTNGSGRQRLLSDPGKLADISHKTNSMLSLCEAMVVTLIYFPLNNEAVLWCFGARLFVSLLIIISRLHNSLALPHPPPSLTCFDLRHLGGYEPR